MTNENISNYIEFTNAISSLAETSSNMIGEGIETQANVYNFDKIVRDYCNNLRVSTAASSDAFYVSKSNEVYLIEFKDNIIDDKMKIKIKKKILESILIMSDIFKINISDTRNNLNFILVHNPNGNKNESRVIIKKRLEELAKNNNPDFGLGTFKNIYFKEVFTLNTKDFERQFASQW